MKDFYFDTFNCLLVPENSEKLGEIISDFYRLNLKPVNDDPISDDKSAAFSRNAYHEKVLNVDLS